jgi:hypothetical protein
VAVRVSDPLTCTDELVGATLTAIGGGGRTVIGALPDFVESALDVAVTVTGRDVLPAGRVTGAI